MARKAQKDNKNLIIGICASIIALIVIIVIAVFVIRGGTGTLNDAFFTSDDTKYVLTLGQDEIIVEDEENPPLKYHAVYYYTDDKITGLTQYYEYENNSDAQAAYDYFQKNLLDDESAEIKEITVNGKYVVMVADSSAYENMTATDIKQQIDFMEALKNMPTEELDDSETVTVEENGDVVEEGGDVVVEEETRTETIEE